MAKNITDKSLANLRLWPKGVSGNPGGMPKGKRISTWIAEFGEMDRSEWPCEGTEAYKSLPANAQIALARLQDALGRDKLALANSQYVEPHGNAPGLVMPVPVAKEQYVELCRTFWDTKK